MKVYRTLCLMMARTALAYRASFVIGLFGLVFQLLAMLAIWRALTGSGALRGFTSPEITAYLLVAFATGALLGTIGDWAMPERIRSGDVAIDLVRPVDYQAARFAECLGLIGMELIAVLVVTAAVLGLAGPVAAPAQPVLFTVSILLVIPVKFAIMYLTSLLAFWTQNYLGLTWARNAVASLLSGAMVPLAFFPGWFQGLAAALPFASVTSTPALIYLGRASGPAAVGLIAAQAAWAVGLIVAGRLAWRGAVRQLTVHGG